MAPKRFPFPDLVPPAQYRWLCYVFAVAAPSAAFSLSWLLQGGTPKVPVYPFFTLSLIVTALVGDFLCGLLALGLSLFYIGYGIVPLRQSLLQGSYQAWLPLVAYIGLNLCVLLIASILRRNQRALTYSEQSLRATFENAGVGVVEVDFEGRITAVNQRLCDILGYSRDELSHMTVQQLTVPEDRAHGEELSAGLRAGRYERYENEKRYLRRDGSPLWVYVTVSAVRDSRGAYVRSIATVQDFSHRKAAEEALIRSEKLASVGRLAATIAHEINNPLAAATNAVYLASGYPGLTPEVREALQLADQELRRAAHISAQTLGFCRNTGIPQQLQLPKIIDEVLGLYAKKLRDRGIRVQQRQRCGPCGNNCEFCLVGDAGELRQVISNLLGNAIDAMADNGTLHVRLARISPVADSEPRVRLTMADNGCGIRSENLRRIFEPFFTTKESVGTGLGLWVTEQIVRKYGGSIRVRSQVGKGTVFSLVVPVAAAEASTTSAAG